MSLAAKGDVSLASGDFKNAIVAYTEAIKDNPTSPDYHLQRSLAYHKSKEYDHALQDSEKAIDLATQRNNKSKRAKGKFRQGLALHGLGRYPEALDCLEAAELEGYTDNALGIWLAKLRKTCGASDNVKSKDIEAPQVSSTIDSSQIVTAPAVPPAPQPRSIRHDWHQSLDRVTVAIYARNVSADTCKVEFREDSVYIEACTSGTNEVFSVKFGSLAEPIKASASTYSVKSTKIELILYKVANTTWPALEKSERPASQAIQYPTSSRSGPKNWDSLAGSEDAAVEPEGDAALTQLFQTLYKDADEDTKKAMIKSYTESGGTALSTDWKTVKQKRVEVTPPDGMEARKFNA